MGHDLRDTFTTRIQTVLRIAHALRDATAISCPPSHSLTTGTATIPISLPSAQPLLPSLLEAGFGFEIASAASQIYQRRAEELKQHIQESIAARCRKAAESRILAYVSPPDLLMKRVLSIFTDVYFRRLEEWKQEVIYRLKQASELPTKVAPRNSRTFNQEYVPLLEHFFTENPFPTHADKMFLAKKSNMRYRQIHVWFQNRRNRTKKEGKTLRKKPTYEGAMKPQDKLYERMKGYMVDSDPQVPKPSQLTSLEGTTETEFARDNTSKDVFASSSPPHAFPSLYPPTCHYDPFPCKSGSVNFRKPEWRRVPYGKPPLPPSTSMDDLVEGFSHLNVRDEIRSRGSLKLRPHAATVAITVIPSPAPHPSLIVSKYFQPPNIVRIHPSARAPLSRLKVFQSPSPTSKPVTLVPFLVPPNRSELPGKRKTAPLPKRFPGRMRNTRLGTTPPESPSTPSPRLFSTSSESRSSSSVSSLTTLSDVASFQELPRLFGSACHSPFNSPIRLHGLGDMVANSPVS